MTQNEFAARVTGIIDEECPSGIQGINGEVSQGFDYEAAAFDSEVAAAFMRGEEPEAVAARLVEAGEMIWA